MWLARRTLLVDAAKLIISCVQTDIMMFRVKMENTAALATAIAPEDITTDFYVKVCFFVVAKWASAVKLGTSITNDLDPQQLDYINNVAGQV